MLSLTNVKLCHIVPSVYLLLKPEAFQICNIPSRCLFGLQCITLSRMIALLLIPDIRWKFYIGKYLGAMNSFLDVAKSEQNASISTTK